MSFFGGYQPQNVLLHQMIGTTLFNTAGAATQEIARVTIEPGMLSVGDELIVEGAMNRASGDIPPSNQQRIWCATLPVGGALANTNAIASFLLPSSAADSNGYLCTSGRRSTIVESATSLRLSGSHRADVLQDTNGGLERSAASVFGNAVDTFLTQRFQFVFYFDHVAGVNARAYRARNLSITHRRNALQTTS